MHIALLNKHVRRALLVALGALAFSVMVVIIVVVTGLQTLAQSACAVPGAALSGGGAAAYASQEPSEAALSDIPENFLIHYREAAAARGNQDWAIIAAIGKVETDHGRHSEGCETGPPNYTGELAEGPMQFLPSTFELVGVDGDGDGDKDPCDPADAIHSAANYLHLEGAPENTYDAIFAYNRADWYVQKVLEQAEKYRAAEAEGGGEEPEQAGVGALGPALDSLGTREALADQNTYDLVDDNLNLHYEDHTAYDAALSDGAADWNQLGVVNIAPAPSEAETDVVVADVSDLSSAGLTSYNSSTGERHIYINSARVGEEGRYPDGELELNKLFTHEFGHAIGFDHPTDTTGPSIMHQQSRINELGLETPSGPTDYDVAEYRERWGEAASGDGSPDGTPVSQEGGGTPGAVFPLPESGYGSYADDWGAQRPGNLHEGTDLMVDTGTPIYSITAGTVRRTSGSSSTDYSEQGGYNIMVEAAEDVGPIRAGDKLYYAHMDGEPAVEDGQEVAAGQQIGTVGDTGYGPEVTRGEFPPHLHLGWYVEGDRAMAESGATNPYPLLRWLEENGGSAAPGSVVAQAPCPPGSPAYTLASAGGPSGGGATWGAPPGGGPGAYPGADPAGGNITSASASYVQEINRIVRDEFGVTGTTYPNHGSTGEAYALDFLAAEFWGEAAQGEFKAFGDELTRFFEANWEQFNVVYIIWWDMAKWESTGTWTPYDESEYWVQGDPESEQHLDHVHVSFSDTATAIQPPGNVAGTPAAPAAPGLPAAPPDLALQTLRPSRIPAAGRQPGRRPRWSRWPAAASPKRVTRKERSRPAERETRHRETRHNRKEPA